MSIVDKDRYQLIRIICWREKAKEYCEKAKTHGLLIKQFDYNPEKFNEELKELTKIEHALQLANNKARDLLVQKLRIFVSNFNPHDALDSI